MPTNRHFPSQSRQTAVAQNDRPKFRPRLTPRAMKTRAKRWSVKETELGMPIKRFKRRGFIGVARVEGGVAKAEVEAAKAEEVVAEVAVAAGVVNHEVRIIQTTRRQSNNSSTQAMPPQIHGARMTLLNSKKLPRMPVGVKINLLKKIGALVRPGVLNPPPRLQQREKLSPLTTNGAQIQMTTGPDLL